MKRFSGNGPISDLLAAVMNAREGQATIEDAYAEVLRILDCDPQRLCADAAGLNVMVSNQCIPTLFMADQETHCPHWLDHGQPCCWCKDDSDGENGKRCKGERQTKQMIRELITPLTPAEPRQGDTERPSARQTKVRLLRWVDAGPDTRIGEWSFGKCSGVAKVTAVFGRVAIVCWRWGRPSSQMEWMSPGPMSLGEGQVKAIQLIEAAYADQEPSSPVTPVPSPLDNSPGY